MKKIIVITIFVFTAASAGSFGQSIFDDLEDINNITSITIPKIAFKALGFLPSKSRSKKVKIVGSFDMSLGALKAFEELRLFVTESADASKKMKNIVHSFIKKSDFFEFLRVNENNSHVKMYIKTSEKMMIL